MIEAFDLEQGCVYSTAAGRRYEVVWLDHEKGSAGVRRVGTEKVEQHLLRHFASYILEEVEQ